MTTKKTIADVVQERLSGTAQRPGTSAPPAQTITEDRAFELADAAYKAGYRNGSAAR